MLIDLVILIIFVTVEAVQGQLAASRVPNRENPVDANGVGCSSNCHPVQLAEVHSCEDVLKWCHQVQYTCNCFEICQLSHLSPPSILQVLAITTFYFTYLCNSTAREVFLGILYGYKMVLQIIALVLALSTHRVKVKGFNDAKYIAAVIYVTSIEVALIIISIYTLSGFVNGFVAVISSVDFLGTTLTLGLVFVPKVRVQPSS